MPPPATQSPPNVAAGGPPNATLPSLQFAPVPAGLTPAQSLQWAIDSGVAFLAGMEASAAKGNVSIGASLAAEAAMNLAGEDVNPVMTPLELTQAINQAVAADGVTVPAAEGFIGQLTGFQSLNMPSSIAAALASNFVGTLNPANYCVDFTLGPPDVLDSMATCPGVVVGLPVAINITLNALMSGAIVTNGPFAGMAVRDAVAAVMAAARAADGQTTDSTAEPAVAYNAAANSFVGVNFLDTQTFGGVVGSLVGPGWMDFSGPGTGGLNGGFPTGPGGSPSNAAPGFPIGKPQFGGPKALGDPEPDIEITLEVDIDIEIDV